ncbi:hypothetical protein SAMN05878426_102312 [Phaeovulum vinaykumarii]|uniref:Uncharacterized protein n=2 Tax=Phaeovulum vinaykumarii TaxID=407234 RepID=A0A1N7L273_9RHOB|nr:hypothetical protein SAMN05421795_102460 [Phaeovulum vinaykumarii]SOC00442.1 hypothetical protein SAMN05878426_102312 [Phaeovulum vinaykumarii]
MMMLLENLARFLRDEEDGAVTVDWVVLTAAVAGLGIAVLDVVRAGTGTLALKVSSYLANTTLVTGF